MSENDSISKRVFEHYGLVKTDYIIIYGSVQGPQKRQLLLTTPYRPTKKQIKKNYELLELR
jgi:ribosomal protein L3